MQLIPYCSKSFSNPANLNEQSLNKPYCESFSTETLQKHSTDTVFFGNKRSWHYGTHRFWHGWLPNHTSAAVPPYYSSAAIPPRSFHPTPTGPYTEPGYYIPHPLPSDPRDTSSKRRAHTPRHEQPSRRHSKASYDKSPRQPFHDERRASTMSGAHDSGIGANPYERNGGWDDHVHDIPPSPSKPTKKHSRDRRQGEKDSKRTQEKYRFASSCSEQQIKNLKAIMASDSGISYTIRRNSAGEIVDIMSA